LTWKIDDPMGNEARKIAWEVVRYTRGVGLDVGCGPRTTFPHWIGLDNGINEFLFNVACEPNVRIKDCGDLSLFSSKSMDFVFSSHLLEHIEPERVAAVLKEWWRVLKEGGHLTLYLPDEDEYPKIGEEGANPDHKWNVNKDRVIEYMRSIAGWDLVDFQKRNQEREYSLYFVFKKIKQGQYFSFQKPKPTKTAAVIRYGALGDLMMASSVIRGLKKEGYHVTLFTSPPQSDIMANDPNIDDFYLQDKDQVPNAALAEFWGYQRKKFDKFVNLCESVEGSFLALPGRALHQWPPALRHKMANLNYVEVSHQLAGIPHDPYIRFYPTQEEREAMRRERSKMGKKVLVWSLAGSAIHKTWAGLDNIVASIMVHHPEWDVVLMGNEDCKILEQGWEKEPRVHRRSGVWKIRQSMTFLEYADCVVGPETGIMNACSHMPVPKVVFLSHSSDENLTRDWENCISLSSAYTVCPGRGNNEAPACHQMHHSWDFCKMTKDGVSQCMADISIEQAWHAIEHAMVWKAEEVA